MVKKNDIKLIHLPCAFIYMSSELTAYIIAPWLQAHQIDILWRATLRTFWQPRIYALRHTKLVGCKIDLIVLYLVYPAFSRYARFSNYRFILDSSYDIVLFKHLLTIVTNWIISMWWGHKFHICKSLNHISKIVIVRKFVIQLHYWCKFVISCYSCCTWKENCKKIDCISLVMIYCKSACGKLSYSYIVFKLVKLRNNDDELQFLPVVNYKAPLDPAWLHFGPSLILILFSFLSSFRSVFYLLRKTQKIS